MAQVASAAVAKVFGVLKDSVSGAVDRFDTMTRFPNVMEQLGFSTEQSEKAVNKLTEGIQGLPTPLDDVVKTAQNLAIMTGDLDTATDTTLALNNAFLASGASTGDASRGLEQYTQMLSRGEVDLESWRTLQETMGLALNKTAEAFGYTGKSAQQDLYAALQDGTITFDEFNSKLIELNDGVGGFADLAKEAGKGIKTSFANIKTAVVAGLANMIGAIDDAMQKEGFGSIADNLDKVKVRVQSAFKAIVQYIPQVVSAFSSIMNVIKPFTPLILGVVSAFLTFGAAISVINQTKKAITGISTAFKVMKAAMAANPLLVIIAALVGLGVALYTAYKRSETFRNAVNGLFNAIKNNTVVKELVSVISNLVGKFKETVSPIKNAASSVDFAKIAFNLLKGVLTAVLTPFALVIKAVTSVAGAFNGGQIQGGISNVVSAFGNLSSGVKENSVKVGQSVGEMLFGILSAIGASLPGIIQGGLSIIAGLITGIAQGLPQVALAATQLILAFTGSILLLMPTIAASATAIIVSFLGSLALGLPRIILAGTNLIVSFISGLTVAIPRIVVSVGALIVTFLGALTSQLPRIINSGVNLLVSFLNGITNNLPKVITTVAKLITTYLDAIASKLPSIISSGANLLVKFLNGLARKLPDVITAAVNVINAFINGIANKLPSIVSSAVNLIVQFLRGIATQIPRIVSAAMDLVDAMVRGILQAQNRLTQAVINLMNGMANSINRSAPQMKSAAGNLLRAIINAFPGGALVTAGFDLMAGLARGIGSAVGSVVSKAKEVAGNIVGAVKGAFKIHSPSRVMRDEVGKYIPQGIAVGIDADADEAVKSVNAMNRKIRLAAIKPEAALGLGGKMSVRPSSVSNTTINNSYDKASDNSEIVSLLRTIADKPFIAQMDGKRVTKAISQEMDKAQGNRIKMADWGIEING